VPGVRFGSDIRINHLFRSEGAIVQRLQMKFATVSGYNALITE